MQETRHISVAIDAPAADVYAYAADPANLGRWAAGLGPEVEVRFAPPNDLGVLDHEITLPSGEVIHVPMRVVPLGDGCEVVFSLRRQDGTTDAELERDAATVATDLARLKSLIEADEPLTPR